MAIRIGGTSIIDDNKNIANVGIITVGISGTSGTFKVGTGVTIDGAGNAYFDGYITVNGGINYLVGLTSIYPQNTNLPDAVIFNTWNGNLDLYFDSQVEVATGIGTTLTATLRRTSSNGVAISTAGVSSISYPGGNYSVLRICFGAHKVKDQAYTTFYPIIPKGLIKFTAQSADYAGNYSGDTQQNLCSFQYGLGAPYGGGYVICTSGGVRWVVAPCTSEVIRSWTNSGDANTRAQQVSGCTGWFVPSVGQYQNPGYQCRAYWDSLTAATYWTPQSITVFSFTPPEPAIYFNVHCFVCMNNGNASNDSDAGSNRYVRSFRCVTY